MKYKKLWITLKAESGHRETKSDYLPETQEKLTIRKLMTMLEEREKYCYLDK